MEFPKKRSEFRDWQNEMNAKVHEYLNLREADYPAVSTQLGLLWHDINNGTLDKTGAFYKAIADVKNLQEEMAELKGEERSNKRQKTSDEGDHEASS